MPETPASAMEHDHDLIGKKAEGGRQILVIDVFFADPLNFQVMIAGTKRPNLIDPSFDGFM